MDLERRQRLLDQIGDINDFSRPRPLVTVAEFFEGNDDPSSIGYNLPDPPAPAEFHEFLSTVEARPEVAAVRVEVKDLEDEDGWPSSDTIWIFTTVDAATVRGWFPDRLAPDEIGVGDAAQEGTPYQPPAGAHGVYAWYD